MFGAALAGAMGGCGGSPPPPLPPSAAIVQVGMEEYRFDHRPDIPGGRVIFEVANSGEVDHQLLLARLPDDLPPLDDQLHSDVRRPVETLRMLPASAPGESTSFAADLAPGRYGLMCFLQEPGDEVTHALKGMNSEFVIR